MAARAANQRCSCSDISRTERLIRKSSYDRTSASPSSIWRSRSASAPNVSALTADFALFRSKEDKAKVDLLEARQLLAKIHADHERSSEHTRYMAYADNLETQHYLKRSPFKHELALAAAKLERDAATTDRI